MDKRLLLTFLLILTGLAEVLSIKCYQCSNCPQVKEADLKECTKSTIPSTTTSTTSTSSTTPTPTSSTTSTSSTTPTPTSSTTSTSSTTPTPTSSSTTSSTTPTPTSSTTSSTTSSSSTTLTPTSSTTSTTTTTTDTPAIESSPIEPDSFNMLNTRANEFLCYTIKLNGTDEVTHRGCVSTNLVNTTTDNCVKDFQNALVSCKTCDVDGCNAGYIVQISTFIVLLSIAVSFLQ